MNILFVLSDYAGITVYLEPFFSIDDLIPYRHCLVFFTVNLIVSLFLLHHVVHQIQPGLYNRI